MLVEAIKVVEVTIEAMNVKARKNSIVGLIVKSPKKARVKARTPRNESRKKGKNDVLHQIKIKDH